ncbi:MAG: (d)CMP kinase [Capsulimonadaceae bacterium]
MSNSSETAARDAGPHSSAKTSPWTGTGLRAPASSALRRLRVAIDGPAGAGKSTVARRVAQGLDYLYIDTGAMYRALAWWVVDGGIDPADVEAVVAAAAALDVRLEPGETDEYTTRVFVGAREITSEVRTPAISSLTSTLSAIPGVRTHMAAAQRAMGRAGGVVMEGRDIGTVVLPEAEVKVYLTASPRRRAERRRAELAARGIEVAYAGLLAEIEERDARDSSRDVAPMVPAGDAHILDSDPLTADEVVARILKWHEEAARHGG